MRTILETDEFSTWIKALRDRVVRVRIQARVQRLAHGNPGQHRVLSNGVCEMKVDVGPGFRVYYTERAGSLIVLLCGGDKGSQRADINTALRLAANL